MSRQRIILVVVLGLVLTLSIGYALFGQTVNVSGSATASGNLTFTATCVAGIHSDLIPSGSSQAAVISSDVTRFNTVVTDLGGTANLPTTMTGGSSNSCSVSGGTVTMSSTLAYPGAMQIFTVKFTNTGTVSGKLNENAEIFNSSSSSSTGTRVSNYNIAIYIGTTNQLPSSAAQVETMQTSLLSHEFAPGDTMYMVYALVWESDSTVSQPNGYEDTFTDTITFDQYNQ